MVCESVPDTEEHILESSQSSSQPASSFPKLLRNQVTVTQYKFLLSRNKRSLWHKITARNICSHIMSTQHHWTALVTFYSHHPSTDSISSSVTVMVTKKRKNFKIIRHRLQPRLHYIYCTSLYDHKEEQLLLKSNGKCRQGIYSQRGINIFMPYVSFTGKLPHGGF